MLAQFNEKRSYKLELKKVEEFYLDVHVNQISSKSLQWFDRCQKYV